MRKSLKMVFAGQFWAGASERGLANGFRELGWAVQEVDSRSHGINAGRHPVVRAAARLLNPIARSSYDNAIVKECKALKPDVFLVIKGEWVSGDILRQIKEAGARAVMYYPDRDFQHRGVFQDSFGEYDLFVTTKTFQQPYLQTLLGPERVAYVPHGYCHHVHRPVFPHLAESGYRVDLLYSGNRSAYKQKWLEDALAGLPEPSVEIVGNRWEENASAVPLSRCRLSGERIGISYAEAIQTARINIAIHFGPAASGWADQVSTRTFEIPACKGFMLHVDNEEVREFFKPGEEIDVFSTPEELADKIRFYLARPHLRAQMIERAYARAVPAYSYATRAKQIAALIEERLEI